MKRLLALTVCFFLLFSLGLINASKARAQASAWRFASTYKITGTGPEDGDLISILTTNGAFIRSQATKEEKLFGVVVFNPDAVFRTETDATPVIRSGEAVVNVTTLAGAIAPGDYITSSAIAGKGQKATSSDQDVLGIALEGFKDPQGAQIDYQGHKLYSGKVSVSVAVFSGFNSETNLVSKLLGYYSNQLGLSILGVFGKSEKIDLFARYIIAAIITILALVFSFRNFGGNIARGIESIGRNPLAGGRIQFIVLVNLGLVIIISGGAIILSLFIVRF